MFQSLKWIVIPVAISALLAGCDEEVVSDEAEVVRSIKHMTLGERAGEQERRIAGVVAASNTTSIAFETGGQVVKILREPGDLVSAGDLLAQLDAEPYELQLAQSENALAQALASLDDAQKKFDQQRKLRTQGYATQTALDSAEAVLKNAKGAVGVAESQLDLARRDLGKTDLKAPFAGVVARRLVDAFQEVNGGEVVYAIQTATDDKIEASLPETLINSVSLGGAVDISFPPLGGATTTGKISEISPQTGDANAYPIKVVLDVAPPGLRAGMSAEVVFRFATAETGTAFVVPITAILADPGPEGEASVFVFNDASSTLVQRPVKVVNIRNNELQVVGALSPGEIIATAGVSFLHDGMRVDLFDPNQL